MFPLAEEAVAAVQQLSGLRTGRIMVGGSTTVGTYLLPDLMASYRSRHPGIEGHIFVGNNTAVIEQLLSGGIGIAVVAGAPADQRLLSEALLEEHLVTVAAPGHPLAGVASLTADMPAGERLILREPGSQTRELQERALAGWGVTETSRAEVWGPEAVKRCVAAGLGISLISEHAVAEDVRAGTLSLLGMEPAPQTARSLFCGAGTGCFPQPSWPSSNFCGSSTPGQSACSTHRSPTASGENTQPSDPRPRSRARQAGTGPGGPLAGSK
ncbi:LysR substrate-binding domain-containing protein [Streptomyces sp. NBC_01210]|uniref:LysR substrate-binding domain-containing protein n=1 Tax=Streptomyces sp. NBC_01210 TaxID=2903774 RepID=UPI002E126C1D|nr:LysR substrate-binding domain-containing protein [Streptomyces sp. NBC_01210]